MESAKPDALIVSYDANTQETFRTRTSAELIASQNELPDELDIRVYALN